MLLGVACGSQIVNVGGGMFSDGPSCRDRESLEGWIDKPFPSLHRSSFELACQLHRGITIRASARKPLRMTVLVNVLNGPHV
jgi:hypothetical protein